MQEQTNSTTLTTHLYPNTTQVQAPRPAPGRKVMRFVSTISTLFFVLMLTTQAYAIWVLSSC